MANKYPESKKFVTKYANQVENEILTRLHNYGKYASGKLYDSIRYTLKQEKDTFILSFIMADYGRYVDKGTKPSKYANMKGKGKGKSKFIESLMKWCRIKGLPENAAFPIRRNIWKYGIAPTNFFTIPTTRRIGQLKKGLEKSMSKDIANELRKNIKKNGN